MDCEQVWMGNHEKGAPVTLLVLIQGPLSMLKKYYVRIFILPFIFKVFLFSFLQIFFTFLRLGGLDPEYPRVHEQF